MAGIVVVDKHIIMWMMGYCDDISAYYPSLLLHVLCNVWLRRLERGWSGAGGMRGCCSGQNA